MTNRPRVAHLSKPSLNEETSLQKLALWLRDGYYLFEESKDTSKPANLQIRWWWKRSGLSGGGIGQEWLKLKWLSQKHKASRILNPNNMEKVDRDETTPIFSAR